ncbi:uncharacterized protein LOC122507934 [Leptopilina heterotoma]|uniref:uncharacterized protein LOC122507934 n=1 Tax=Leptopilina heterotoma TaxID=63436 RepID=UPI001CA7F6DF|nr:uncharacterized protein LOC122507934 [Leptopilina heterotoma]
MPSHKLQKKQVQQQRVLRKNFKDDLLKWICEKHATNSPLDRKLLRQKALQLSQTLELINFKCSEQWITVFLKRYGFSTSLTTCAGPYFKDYRIWIDLMRPILTQYKYKDIFNVDELTMYSNVCPLKIPKNAKASNQDLINATNLISILLCCNSSGTDKLPLLITGPYKCNLTRDDCIYHYNENSTINDQLFIEWIMNLNEIMSQKQRQILLLLHRHKICALGNNRQLSNVKLIFFPTNFPPHLRPLRRDVFHSTKMNYRLNYAEKIHRGNCKWEFNEMIMAILQSWSQVPRELIVSSFQRTKFRSDDKLIDINNDEWEKLNTGVSFKKLITFDDHLSDTIINNYCYDQNNTNDQKVINREKHKYNLRTTNQIFQIDECDEFHEMKNEIFKSEKKIQNTIDKNTKTKINPIDEIENISQKPINLENNGKNEENILNFGESSKKKTLKTDFSEDIEMNVSKDSMIDEVTMNLEEKKSTTNFSNEGQEKNRENFSNDGKNEKKGENIHEDRVEELKSKIPENLNENHFNTMESNSRKNMMEDNFQDLGKNTEMKNKDEIIEFCEFLGMEKKLKFELEKGNVISKTNVDIIEEINSLEVITIETKTTVENSEEKNDCHQTEENSIIIDNNEDHNMPSTSGKRNHSPLHVEENNDDDDDDVEPLKKIQKTLIHHHRCNKHEARCDIGCNTISAVTVLDKNTQTSQDSQNSELDCSSNLETNEVKEKNSGSSFIFTKSGTLNSRPSKD